MATANPDTVSVHSSVKQPLFTTTVDQFGKTVYTSVGRTAGITFDTTDIQIGLNASFMGGSAFSIAGNLTYEMSLQTVITNFTPYGQNYGVCWYDVYAQAVISQPNTHSFQTTVFYTPSENTVVVPLVYADGPNQPGVFEYPAQLEFSTATITAIAGWTE